MTTPSFELAVLGPVEVRRGGVPVAAGGPKQRALLAYLALNARTAVSVDSLVDALWESPPKSARKVVRMYASRLRRLLEEDLSEERGSYRLPADDEQIDLGRFQRLVREGETALRAGDARAAGRHLRAALALWRGPVLAGLDDEPFVAIERTRIEELRVGALERRIEADLAAGEHAALVPEVESLVAQHPFRERFRAQLMLALYRAGRQADALETYQAARKILVEELGVEPGRELKRLQRAILAQDTALDVASPSEVQRLSRLPVPPTRLIGRETELIEARELLARTSGRLLTVTGPPGTGKTRLALELAATVASEYADGAVFVDLSPLTDPALVPSALAQALGVPEREESVLEAVKRFLGDRELLLVLDNFEQLLSAAPALSELVAAAAGLKLLVTSRAILRLTGEQEYHLEPLRPSSAVDLFVERARCVKPDFALTDENRDAVADICGRVDGLPLALELAAARVRLLGVHELAERLAHPLSLLGGGARDLPDRQRTLRATIEWSYGLLAPEERVLLARLSVFAGSFDLDAAEEVCGPALDGDLFGALEALVASSLVREVSGRRDRPRFALLATIREYAAERLEASGEADDLRRRHALEFLELAEESEEGLTGADQLEWLQRLELELDNLRAALAWTIRARRGETALRLAAAMTRFWHTRSVLNEGRTWLAAALEIGADQPPELRAKALNRLAVLALRVGLYAETKPIVEESIALSRQIGDAAGTALSLIHLSAVAMQEGDNAHAEEMLSESLALYERLGDERGVAVGRTNLGHAAVILGEYARAVGLCEQAIAFFDQRGDRLGRAFSHFNLGMARLFQDRPKEAAEALRTGLRAAASVGNTEEIIYCLVGLATAGLRRGEPERAARLLGAAERLSEDIAFVLDPFEQELCDEAVAGVRAALPAETLERAWSQGRALDGDEAVALAVS